MQIEAPQMEVDEAFQRLAARLLEAGGECLTASSSRPLPLDESGVAWVVTSGKIDLFYHRREAGRIASARAHLFRVEARAALFGMEGEGAGSRVGLVAVAAAETELIRVPTAGLRRLCHAPEHRAAVATLLDGWVQALWGAVIPERPPKECLLLEPDQSAELAAGQSFRPAEGVVWIRSSEGGVLVGGNAAIRAPDEHCWPLAETAWALVDSTVRLRTGTTLERVATDWSAEGLAQFHELALAALEFRLGETEGANRGRLTQRAERHAAVLQGAAAQIASVLHPEAALPAEGAGGNSLLAACRRIGAALGVNVPPARAAEGAARRDPVAEIARSARLRTRVITLTGDWWRRDNGPMLGFMGAELRPVALLPTSPSAYELVDPERGERRRVTAAIAADLAPEGYVFYQGFPDRLLTARDVMQLAVKGGRGDLTRLLLLSAFAGITALAAPVATGVLFHNVVPSGEKGQLLEIALALVSTALASGLFLVARGVLLTRLESRADAQVQSAVWDRLLKLPLPFFRRFSAGELSGRAMGISAMRQLLAGTTVTSALAALFSLFSLAYMFTIDGRLATMAAGFVLAALLVSVTISVRQVRLERRMMGVQNELAGKTLQLLNGVTKLRVAGAEVHAFAEWSRRFAEQKELAYRARLAGARMTCFNGVWPILCTLGLFLGVGALRTENWPAGLYLAFAAAFGQLLAAAMAVSGSVANALRCVPLYEMARPILEEAPEAREARAEAGDLSGAIEVSHISFRYAPNLPLVLDNLSFRVEPGQCVAIVGPSGSGKSSIFRLLLGFDPPEAGSIFYNGHDLAQLDPQSVRRQTGVVMQNGRLLSGNLFRNITGGLDFTLDEAWEAARMAGLDRDIRQMPMGMHTPLTEGASTLSGGQRQRLMIARALIPRPRILLFDEATSALDNRTQEIVTESLKTLQATRLVIAHRLSTIQDADQILVLDGGRIVERGTFAELMRRQGAFYELAERQLA